MSWSEQWAETKSKSLRGEIRTIVKAIEAAAPALVVKLDEAARQAEIGHQEWLVQQERWKREEDRRRVDQSITESKTDLRQVIERWSDVVSIERFYASVEERARSLPEIERQTVLERLALAREFVGSQDPLDFFRAWKTPGERYSPLYPHE